MKRTYTAAVMLAMLMNAEAFAPSSNKAPPTSSALFFLDAVDTEETTQLDSLPVSKKSPSKKNKHKEGIFSPAVKFGKTLLGEVELNRLRGNAIAIHSDVIKNFVDTAETEFGTNVLRTLFKFADRNQNGKIEMNELEDALKTLGFHFLEEKQIQGIFKRAGGEEKGFLTTEEFMAEAPKTLKTNLVKLAKSNGGELGFLV